VSRVAALAALVVLAAGTGEAASFALDQRQAQEAVEFGERSVTRDGLGGEWRVRNGAGDAVTDGIFLTNNSDVKCLA
jgi:hypothetical protein